MITKKSQVSLEYIIFFNFALILFLVIGTVLVSGIEKTRKTEIEAQYLAKDIKVATIIASLSYTNLNSSIDINKLDSGNNICIEVYGDPDNMIIVNEIISQNKNFIAREFLPIISIPPSIPMGAPLEKCSNSLNDQGKRLVIEKNEYAISLS